METYRCEWCDKTYLSKGSLKKHSDTAKSCLANRGKSPPVTHKCDFCGCLRTQKYHLVQHQVICKKKLELEKLELEKAAKIGTLNINIAYVKGIEDCLKHSAKISAPTNETHGEKLVSAALDALYIKYYRQVCHPMLKRLRFDFNFECGDKVYYVEFDGTQHQKQIQRFHATSEEFEKARQRDLIKNHCIRKSANCILIRLDHRWVKKTKDWQRPQIVEKLAAHIESCIASGEVDNKIICDRTVYDWIDDEPTESTIEMYLVK